ncbi:hypothetical protein CANTEDRAFT_115522 [Yamadazyma tenuis ATCC 10573]|uniref:Uncharacterized protein n=1 Tax=Candida tenuis (strain ATCC 10573 / BCRC 21748 / CBS 615 / JCM 9827 / NBRC 10315 / NRRL Y-1498 / VKM Y-70) TaxID=590646 RepID=G3BAP3_CANTC|nr:uncharacterized protein CANTEDRAFT_115522 [Yamadazyma tenuis ATCC 10573]EGV62071.1 hypothetical protein CANTEDRAFT_115522 [Yamadazyma tenuis ATCC 10573]
MVFACNKAVLNHGTKQVALKRKENGVHQIPFHPSAAGTDITTEGKGKFTLISTEESAA